MRRNLRAGLILMAVSAMPSAAKAQWDVTPKAATPAVPYWLTLDSERAIELLPLVWFNDLDGFKDQADSSGCCVVAVAGRHRLGHASFWWALGFGLEAGSGTPAAIEAAAEIDGGSISFRKLHGRSGFSAFYPLHIRVTPPGDRVERLSIGVSAIWLDDPRYLETLTMFDCPAQAPAVPCEPIEIPYTWSGGEDYALVVEAERGAGSWSQPRLQASIGLGLEVIGGDHGYGRLEAEAAVKESVGSARLDARLAAGLATGQAPQQRRFLVEGADPIRRWLNPYLDARGALLDEVPFYVSGGPGLRVYEATRPLVRRYLGVSAQLSRGAETASGFWAEAGPYAAASWTPGLPARFGPEQLNEDGDLLFDWRELAPGEGQELGQFRARSLRVSEFWADAGMTVTGGYRKVSVTFALPLWVSEPAFASEPIAGGKRKALAVRWAFTIGFNTTAGLTGRL